MTKKIYDYYPPEDKGDYFEAYLYMK